MIQGINVTKKFGDLVLLDHYNFEIQDGDFVCFSGASGKGKTTLLNIIGLIEPIDSGKILIGGTEYLSNKQKLQFYRSEVGFVFQNFALIENKTVLQNLEIIKPKYRTEMGIEEALETVGLPDKINNKVYTLSGGEQQRVALARLFLKQCKIILADEPTGSLDRDNASAVLDILKELNHHGKTVILVSHDEEVKAMANTIIEL